MSSNPDSRFAPPESLKLPPRLRLHIQGLKLPDAATSPTAGEAAPAEASPKPMGKDIILFRVPVDKDPKTPAMAKDELRKIAPVPDADVAALLPEPVGCCGRLQDESPVLLVVVGGRWSS